MERNDNEAVEREFVYRPEDFTRVCTLIRARAGIALAPTKQDMVYSRLTRRLRHCNLRHFRDYLDLVERSDEELEAFTNALTTNLTAFFREPHHFEVLTELLAKQPRGTQLNLWSAAASTGEEAYSMAMTVIEHYGSDDVPVKILATDIDTQVLRTAQLGVYPLERIENIGDARKRRFFLRGTGDNEGSCRVRDALRRMVEFRPFNLLEPRWDLKGQFNAIFCRNVMIYFDKQTQRGIVERCLPHLTPDGLFLAGHSESFFHCADLIEPIGRTVYRLARSGSSAAAPRMGGVK